MEPDNDGRVSGRLTFQENMKLLALPDRSFEGRVVKRYMSQRAAWVPGSDLPRPKDNQEEGTSAPNGRRFRYGNFAYGGHVYAQAGMAASRAFDEMQRAESGNGGRRKEFGIHTVHGYFSETGFTDRPFIYEVYTVAANPSFHNLLVTARQPTQPATNQTGDHYTLEDSKLPLGPVCYNALTSFRPAGVSQADIQEPSVQSRFSSILNSRPPSAWNPAPLSDIDGIMAIIPPEYKTISGTFPAVDMKKVDLTAFNEGKPVHERRELLLYRLIAPLPAGDPNAHILTHAFEADRNGLLMVGNHAGFGFEFAKAASLSYSFVVHVNPRDAEMEYREGNGDSLDDWWVQEVCFPRVEAGRGILLSKIWSPKGVHVATEYQDGIIRRGPQPGERGGKL